MSKGTKACNAAKVPRSQWVLVYNDVFGGRDTVVMSEPMSFDAALVALKDEERYQVG